MAIAILYFLLNIFNPVNSIKKNVYLTFDDGPTVQYTPKVLDILKKQKIESTFFVMGCMFKYNKKARLILKRTHKEGHSIGNHTYSHRDIRKLSYKRFYWEIKTTHNLIKKVTGYKSTIFRPPHGFLPKWSRSILKQFGYVRIVFWDVYGDLETRSHIKLSKLILKRIYKSKKKNVVVLLHDIYPHTVKALPIIIKTLKKDKNISFKKL